METHCYNVESSFESWFEGYLSLLKRKVSDSKVSLNEIISLFYEDSNALQYLEGFVGKDEFSSSGRGFNYIHSISKNPIARVETAKALLDEIPRFADKKSIVLDLFCGNGYLENVSKNEFNDRDIFINSDLSPFMVEQCIRAGKTALLQPAQNLFCIRSNSADAVILAYGVHHVPLDSREEMFRESNRVLKKGGVLLFHDFEDISYGALFFKEVVHEFSKIGHDHPHFEKVKLLKMIERQGFEQIEKLNITDSISAISMSKEESLRELTTTVKEMFKLDLLTLSWQETLDLISKYFPLKAKKKNGVWMASLYRDSLILKARKSSD